MGFIHVIFWQYGLCNGREARRHRIFRNVQFVLWESSKQGHKMERWINFHGSRYKNFIIVKKRWADTLLTFLAILISIIISGAVIWIGWIILTGTNKFLNLRI